MPNIAALAPMPEGEGHDDRGGEARFRPQAAEGVSEVLREGVEHDLCDTGTDGTVDRSPRKNNCVGGLNRTYCPSLPRQSTPTVTRRNGCRHPPGQSAYSSLELAVPLPANNSGPSAEPSLIAGSVLPNSTRRRAPRDASRRDLRADRGEHQRCRRRDSHPDDDGCDAQADRAECRECAHRAPRACT